MKTLVTLLIVALGLCSYGQDVQLPPIRANFWTLTTEGVVTNAVYNIAQTAVGNITNLPSVVVTNGSIYMYYLPANFDAYAAGAGRITVNDGGFNTGFGYGVLSSNNSGSGNSAFGYSSLMINTNGINNTAYGIFSLADNASNNNNTALGFEALQNATANGNTALGWQAGMNIGGGSNNLMINNPGTSLDANIIRIGTDQSDTYIVGNIHAFGAGITNLGYGNITNPPTLYAGSTASNSFVQLTNGNATDLALLSNATLGFFPWITFNTNVIGVNGAGVASANGTYIQTVVPQIWTNVSGNGSAIAFVNPIFILQTNAINLYSTTNLFLNSVWLNILGTTAVPTNSGFGYVESHNGIWDTNVWASSLVGLVQMRNLDTTKVLTNGESTAVVFNSGFTVQNGGQITAVAGGFIGGVMLGSSNGDVSASSVHGGAIYGNGGGLTNISLSGQNFQGTFSGQFNGNLNGSANVTAPLTANYLLPTLTYGVTNPFDAFGIASLPKYRGHYVYSRVINMYTNSDSPTNYFAKLNGNSTWTFCTVTNDNSMTTASNYVWYIGSNFFPTNDAISWVFGNQNTDLNSGQATVGNVWLGTSSAGPTNILIGINATASSVTTIGGAGSIASNPHDDGNHVVDFFDNEFNPPAFLGGLTIQYFTDPKYGSQLGTNYTSNLVLQGSIPDDFAATNTGGNVASIFINANAGEERGHIIRYKAKNVAGLGAIAGCYESQTVQGIYDFYYFNEYGHNHFGNLPHLSADGGKLDGPGWNEFWGGYSNTFAGINPYPTIFIHPDYLNKNALPTVITNGGISTDGTNIIVDQSGRRGAILMGTNSAFNGGSLTNINLANTFGTFSTGVYNQNPHLPTAVTLTGSAYLFTNTTPNVLECYFSGSVAYSVSKNGIGVFGSLAADGYFLLQPTNQCTITYTVAPTFYTNSMF